MAATLAEILRKSSTERSARRRRLAGGEGKRARAIASSRRFSFQDNVPTLPPFYERVKILLTTEPSRSALGWGERGLTQLQSGQEGPQIPTQE